jgi:hypothetical protein
MGRVPKRDQVFYVSYFLKGKASDYYNQVVVPDEESYDLRKFFIGLFDFIFPPDFRISQRRKLNRCYQNEKSVSAHVAEFMAIYSTIGLPQNDQERVIKLWSSLRGEIQQEMLRKDLEPEVSTWDEVVRGAECAEVLFKLNLKGKKSVDGHNNSGSSKEDSNQRRDQSNRGGFRGRGRGRGRDGKNGNSSRNDVLHTSAVEVPNKSPKEKKLSPQKRNELLAKGLCFTCVQRWASRTPITSGRTKMTHLSIPLCSPDRRPGRPSLHSASKTLKKTILYLPANPSHWS